MYIGYCLAVRLGPGGYGAGGQENGDSGRCRCLYRRFLWGESGISRKAWLNTEMPVYRFDKRTYTYASELAQKKDATHEDEYIVDAVNAVQLVSGQERIDPDRSKLSVTLPHGLNERKKGSR